MGLLQQFMRYKAEKQEAHEWASSTLFGEGFSTPTSNRARPQEPDAEQYCSWAEVRAAFPTALGRSCAPAAPQPRSLRAGSGVVTHGANGGTREPGRRRRRRSQAPLEVLQRRVTGIEQRLL